MTFGGGSRMQKGSAPGLRVGAGAEGVRGLPGGADRRLGRRGVEGLFHRHSFGSGLSWRPPVLALRRGEGKGRGRTGSDRKSPIGDSRSRWDVRFAGMRSGISFTPSSRDRQRLQAIVADPKSPERCLAGADVPRAGRARNLGLRARAAGPAGVAARGRRRSRFETGRVRPARRRSRGARRRDRRREVPPPCSAMDVARDGEVPAVRHRGPASGKPRSRPESMAAVQALQDRRSSRNSRIASARDRRPSRGAVGRSEVADPGARPTQAGLPKGGRAGR